MGFGWKFSKVPEEIVLHNKELLSKVEKTYVLRGSKPGLLPKRLLLSFQCPITLYTTG
jgi:hypothetical protein